MNVLSGVWRPYYLTVSSSRYWNVFRQFQSTLYFFPNRWWGYLSAARYFPVMKHLIVPKSITYSTGVFAAQLQWHLFKMNMITYRHLVVWNFWIMRKITEWRQMVHCPHSRSVALMHGLEYPLRMTVVPPVPVRFRRPGRDILGKCVSY